MAYQGQAKPNLSNLKSRRTRFTEVQILNKVIDGLMNVPLPKEGKNVSGSGDFGREIREAFRLARFVQWASNKEQMNEAYTKFQEHINRCVANGEI